MIPAFTALLTSVAASVLTALLFVLPTHSGLHRHTAIVSLVVGVLAGVAAFVHTRRLSADRPAIVQSSPLSPWAWLVFAAFAYFAVREFGFLVYHNGDHLAVGSPNDLGDVSLHVQLARYFANGARWWPEHPEITGQTLRYYPGVDLFQSLLLLVHSDELLALTWVSLAGAAATAALLYRWGGSFAVAGFLFSGGLAGFKFFYHGEITDYQAALGWKNLALAIFVTQRPFLYALPAGLLLFIQWREKFFEGSGSARASRALFGAPAEKSAGDDPSTSGGAVGGGANRGTRGACAPQAENGLIPFWVELLLYATLPIFHLFAFVFVSLLLGWWFVAYFRRVEIRSHLLRLVGLALVPATIQVFLMTAHFSAAGGKSTWVEFGWMAHGKPPLAWVGFWMLNFGAWTILAVALWVQCLRWEAGRKKSSDAGGAAAAFVIPAGIIFVLACNFMFAVWDWDNTKLMLWAYVAVLPFIWQVWVRPLTLPLRVGMCVLLFFSGAISLVGGMAPSQMNFSLLPRGELDRVRRELHGLPVEARFACAPDYNHPLVYCGRKLAMGYDGHIYSQGIDYSEVAQRLDDLMTGKPDWRDAARELGVRYVYWGDREEKKFPGSTRPWAEDNARPVARSEWGSIYDLGAPE